ncbi:MAG: HD domain-containing protein, partial [Synechococcales bacterium]|nr:HD domain-containing protein [Synechococcales bacterium]
SHLTATHMETTQTPLLGVRFEQALCLAHRLHRHQIRKGHPTPYIAHLLSVTALVLEDGGSEDEAIAALLHDAIEDQGGSTTRELIRHQFGETVISLIEGCTESDSYPKPPWIERKQRHLTQLKNASPAVRRITLADKLHNARSLLADYETFGEALWQRFAGDREGTLWYYQQVIQMLATQDAGRLGRMLIQTVQQLTALNSYRTQE